METILYQTHSGGARASEFLPPCAGFRVREVAQTQEDLQGNFNAGHSGVFPVQAVFEDGSRKVVISSPDLHYFGPKGTGRWKLLPLTAMEKSLVESATLMPLDKAWYLVDLLDEGEAIVPAPQPIASVQPPTAVEVWLNHITWTQLGAASGSPAMYFRRNRRGLTITNNGPNPIVLAANAGVIGAFGSLAEFPIAAGASINLPLATGVQFLGRATVAAQLPGAATNIIEW